MLAALVLISTLLYGAQATSPFTTSVDCTAQGFKPSFSYDMGQTANAPKILAATLVLGDSSVTETSADAWCKGSTPSDAGPVSQTSAMSLTSSTLDATKYTSANNGGIGEGYLPYQQDSTGGVVGSPATTRCGGTLEHYVETKTSIAKIKYEVHAKVIIRRKYRSQVIRTTSYPFVIRCAVTRELGPISSQKGFKVKTALVDETWTTATDGQVTDDFDYEASLKLYTDQSYGSAATSTVEVDNNAKVYIRVEQDAGQDLFKFVVDECYATVGNDQSGREGKDTFWMNKCRKDSTVTGAADGATKYKIEMNSFYFPAKTSSIFFHCKLTVCLASTASNDATCSYPTNCATSNAINEDTSGGVKRRRRRSTEESGFIGSKIISSSQSVLVNQAQVFAPSCGNGFIYDRVIGGCSNENLVEINGIYLGAAAWDPAYANITSDAFKTMAAAREYQLWVLLQVTQRTQYIHGVKIIRARQGSVILDAVIRHAPSVSAEEAFFQLEQALQTKPSVTRVMNLLQIREGKTIELVPIVVAGQEPDTEKLILIVVVVVLFVVVSIAGVTLFKVRQGRQQPASTTTSFDNKAVDA